MKTYTTPVVLAAVLLAFSPATTKAQSIVSWDTSGYIYGYNVTRQLSDGMGGTIGLTLIPIPEVAAPGWYTTGTPHANINNSDPGLNQSGMTGELSGLTFTGDGLDTIRQMHQYDNSLVPYGYSWRFDFSNYNAPEGLGATSSDTVLFISDIYSGLTHGKGYIDFSAQVLGGGTVNFNTWDLKVSSALSAATYDSGDEPYNDYAFNTSTGRLESLIDTPAPGSTEIGIDGAIAALFLGDQRYTSITAYYRDYPASGYEWGRWDNWAMAVGTVVPVPEPSSSLLIGLTGMLAILRRR